MSVYRYIAQVNPNGANEVCLRNGFGDIYSDEELVDTLQIIAAQGEYGLKDVMSAHPDKDVIVELFLDNTSKTDYSKQPEVIVETAPPVQQNFANAEGQSKIVSQTNTFILIGAVLVSLAILSTVKSGT